MRKLIQLTIFSLFLCVGAIQAQDSLFFYKTGGIIYKVPSSEVDSVTFVPLDYYQNLRCNTVMNDLKSNTELTLFAQMIQIAGYEKKLDNTTIWAPVNSALSQINLSDTALVRRIVTNQIAINKVYTSIIGNGLLVQMIDGKKYLFSAASGNYYLDKNTVLTSNVFSANSIIHVMNGYTPYKLNIWEYITEGSGHDLMKAYVNSHTTTVFNASTGTYVTTNDLKDQLAFTVDESNTGSFIIPTDEAWNDAYTKLYPYCVVPSSSLTDAQAEATKFAIVLNNAFSSKLNPTLTDTSYIASSGFQLKSPSVMLAGAQTTEQSNGTSYTVSQLKMYNPEYWSKEVRLEAEDASWGRTTSFYTPTVMYESGRDYVVSNNKYLYLADISSSSLSTLFVNFPIPNTLSTKYNIYCVFLPSTVGDPNDVRPSKVKFYLTYKNASQNQVTNASIDATNTVQAATGTSAIFTTNTNTITKMLVAKNFVFPFSNLIYNNASKITVALKVQNATAKTVSEMASYNRNLRIDCIVLEAVQ